MEELELYGEHSERWEQVSAALGGGTYRETEPLPDTDGEDPPVVLFVSDFRTGNLELQPLLTFSQLDLTDSSVAVLDAMYRVYIWTGKDTDHRHKEVIVESTKKVFLVLFL